jgi:energy-coupling factor transport system ATP-binding protein
MRVKVEGLSYRYPQGVLALQGIDLSIEAGESLAIIGENGAGKTTLAKHLNGLLKPTQGRVLVGDLDTRQLSTAQLARFVSYLFQNPDDQLFERTVWREVAFGPRNLGCTPQEVEARTQRALETVGLLAHAQDNPFDLHPSERKLLALAATLAMEAPIILLDEPTTGLDHRTLEMIGRVVERLKEWGRTVIVISHDMDFCMEHCARIVLMAQGRVLADGPSQEVFAHGELLARAGVDPPQLVRLSQALGLPGVPRQVDEFLDLLAISRQRSR